MKVLIYVLSSTYNSLLFPPQKGCYIIVTFKEMKLLCSGQWYLPYMMVMFLAFLAQDGV